MDKQTRRIIEQDITDLIYRYAMLNDAGKWDELAELYTIDARFSRPSAPDDYIIGREAIRAAFKARPPRKTRHFVSNVMVEAEHPARIKAFSLIMLFQGEALADAEGALPKMTANSPLVGYFEDEIVLMPEGYQFAQRRGGLDFMP
ncbi:MAG: nuclear transport factor 2 family protein [Sphingomonadaceae bacterium]